MGGPLSAAVDGQQTAQDLTWAGIALAVGYLSRYEIVVATAGAVALVGVIVIFRSPAGNA